MFAYCGNNPVNVQDPTGHWLEWIVPFIFPFIISGCSKKEPEETNAVVLSNKSEGFMRTAKIVGKNLAKAIGRSRYRVQALTDSNYSEVWDGITESYVAIQTHGSPGGLSGEDFSQRVSQLERLNKNENIKCLIITACSTGGNNGTSPNVGQVLSQKIASDGVVVCSTTDVWSGGTNFRAENGGVWVVYQNGVKIRSTIASTITMETAIALYNFN